MPFDSTRELDETKDLFELPDFQLMKNMVKLSDSHL